MNHNRRRKKLPVYCDLRTVKLSRVSGEYGFTISGQQPCVLNCIVDGSPAETVGLRAGNYLISVNGRKVDEASHEDIVNMINNSRNILRLQIAENCNFNSSEENNSSISCSKRKNSIKSRNNDSNGEPSTISSTNAITRRSSECGVADAESNLKNSVSNGNKIVGNNTNNNLTIKTTIKLSQNKIQYAQNGNHNHLNAINSLPISPSPFSHTCNTDKKIIHRIVVNHFGIIDIPYKLHPSKIMQELKKCIKCIKTEKRTPMTVLLTIGIANIKLTNTDNKIIAEYPSYRISFCDSLAEMDKQYIGIFIMSDKDTATDVQLNSCHIFTTNYKLIDHSMHLEICDIFNFTCTKTSQWRVCEEFPDNCNKIIDIIRSFSIMNSIENENGIDKSRWIHNIISSQYDPTAHSSNNTPKIKEIKSETNQSKILDNDLIINNHDKNHSKNEKVTVPEDIENTEVPVTIPVLKSPVEKRKRGRPRKNLAIDTIQDSISFTETLIIKEEFPTMFQVNESVTIPQANKSSIFPQAEEESSKIPQNNDIDIDSSPVKHHFARSTRKSEQFKNKSSDQESSVEDSAEIESEQKYKKYKRRRSGCRGRKRGKASTRAVDSDYVPRTLESNCSQKECKPNDKESNNSKVIVCGKCTENMPENQWTKHNLNKHNNMGWREGESVPDYENDEKLWRSVLSIAHKRRKGSLLCEKCCTVKRSVIGFISHYQFCGKTDEEREALKWTCPICYSVFMPSSQDAHERMHRDAERQKELLLSQTLSNKDECDGKGKRKAAKSAATKILEFTALVKDTEELPHKKIKKTGTNVEDLIEHPRKSNVIPSVWKSCWKKAIATKEMAKCRQPGCTFSTTSLDEIYEHHSKCKFVPISTFTCKICKYLSETLQDMTKHVKEKHANKIQSEDDSDFSANEESNESDANNPPVESSCNKKSSVSYSTQIDKNFKNLEPVAFLRKEKNYRDDNFNMTFVPALRWTLEFEMENYSLSHFEDFIPNNFTLLTNCEANKFLPKLTISMRAKQIKYSVENSKNDGIKSEKWKTWKRFESSVEDEFPIFFVGGPIWSMAWLPIPTVLYSENVNQYIAISTHSQMNDSFVMGKSYKFNNIIQIWNIGNLNHSLSCIPQTPQLSYAIAHDKGTIWDMEWCPSGAYENMYAKNNSDKVQKSNRRMGLLAVASSDGCVHIYSIVFPEELNFIKTHENNLPIYKSDPIITLYINQLLYEQNENNWQCLTLSWSKMSGHDTIAAGFSNGYVALWDLTSKSPLLVTKKNATLTINSYRHFHAHKQAITGITIIPLRDKRFLASVSIDRTSKFWDLEDISNCVNDYKKGVAVNSTWMTHWPNILSSFDDVFGLGHTVTSTISLRDSYNKSFPLLPTNSPTYGLASSDYANGICHGTTAGELVAIFPFQMLHIRDTDKLTKKRWLVSSIEIIDLAAGDSKKVEKIKNKDKSNLTEYKYMPETYEKCSQKFGIIFHDDVNNSKHRTTKRTNKKNPFNSDTMATIPVEQYSFTSINRITWNPNAWSYLWLGVGYQNGFVRILHVKSMSMQNAIMKLLPDHVKMRLNKEEN